MISAESYRPAFNDKGRTHLQKGSRDYFNWWSEQYKRCIEGYTPPGGTRISGAYYFYLNFCIIDILDPKTNRKITGNPFYRDQDHEYFHEVEQAEKGGYGLIVLKARRKGFSMNNAGLLLHEWSFYPNSVCAVASENEDYVKDFRKRVFKAYNAMDPKLKLKMISGTGDDLESFVSGYKQKENGEWVKKGFLSEMHFRIAKDPNCFRGLALKWMFVEEGGEVKKLKKLYFNSEECFREGSLQFGIPIIGGTSNQISHENKDFQEMYFDAPEYNLKSVFIPASKNYFGFFDMSTGKSDVPAATEDIKKRLEAKKGDKLAYYTFKQEMPLEPQDAFVAVGSSPFDLDKINRQKAYLLTDTGVRKVIRGRLDWPRTKDGRIVQGGKPTFVPDDDGPFELLDPCQPIEGFSHAHVAGVDSYYINDEFEEKGTMDQGEKSKGCMYVYRRNLGMNNIGNIPVAKYLDRPQTKDIFCENCWKLAVYFDCQMLVEYTDDYFLKYFDTKNAMRYIKERPSAADSAYAKPTNKYGIHMKDYQKNLLVELTTDYVSTFIDNIFFSTLLDDLAKFGSENTDEAMAFGLALIHDMDIVKIIAKPTTEEKEERMFTFHRNDDGTITYISGSNKGGSKAPTLNYNL